VDCGAVGQAGGIVRAIENFMNPNWVIIGVESDGLRDVKTAIYARSL
jgi:threonine dehydratase